MTRERIYLSPPWMGGRELDYVQEVFAENWIAPVGPHLTRFEQAFAETLGGGHCCAVTSGTAALHLALILSGVKPDEEVLCSDMTFVASCNAILYMGARPVLVDCDRESWQMDPNRLEDFLKSRAQQNRVPKTLMPVHLYGHPVDLDSLNELCGRYEIVLIEDAAEALGARYKGRAVGLDGRMGAYSFNGNKLITTSGGGMFISHDEALVHQARYLATQARDPAPHYEHSQAGYNYRMSNVLAAIGLGQLEVLDEIVRRTRKVFAAYTKAFAGLDAVQMMPVPEWAEPSHWLSCITLNPKKTKATPETVRQHLESLNVESRPLWKPMHLQPLFADTEVVGGEVAEALFAWGLCLPSGAGLTEEDLEWVAAGVCEAVSA